MSPEVMSTSRVIPMVLRQLVWQKVTGMKWVPSVRVVDTLGLSVMTKLATETQS